MAAKNESGGGKSAEESREQSTQPPQDPQSQQAMSEHASDAGENATSLAGLHDDAGPREPFPVVGIGCSAGGLTALKEFFAAMPGDTGMAFVVVQHLHPQRESLLAELLGPHVSMPVSEIRDGIEVQPNQVYIIRPAKTLIIREGRLRLLDFDNPGARRKPVDMFFESLAREQRERSICVILTGTGSNGTMGMRTIKAEGGMAMVQAPETAEFDGMPRSAIGSGLIDFILPVEQMAEQLQRYVKHPYLLDSLRPASEGDVEGQIEAILSLLHARVGHDFRAYKRPTLLRRIHRRMSLLQIKDLHVYADRLRGNPDEIKALVQDLLITVTNFFRDPEAWETFEKEVVRPLVRDREPDIPIRVTPVRQGREGEDLLLVSFEERQPELPHRLEDSEDEHQPAVYLETELRSVRRELERTIEELETANEEMKASNEEVTPINEELQSSNEELETSKEELQSLNEELATVNHQLQNKVEELEDTNNDITNLLTSTDIAVLFLDTEFRIRRFTPATRALMHMLQSDIGRPVGDLAPKFVDQELLSDAETVLGRLIPMEREIRTEQQRWYLRRILPYRTQDNRIDGVVITFTDITARRRAEDELRQLNQTLEQRIEQRTRAIQLSQEVAEIANEADTVSDAIHKTLQRVCETWNWPVGHACLPDEHDPQTFVSGGVWYTGDRERLARLIEMTAPLRCQKESWLVGRVLSTAQPAWVAEISSQEHDSRAKQLRDAGITSAAAFPILVQQRVVGVLEFYDVQPTEPTDLLLKGMAQIGSQLGRVVERVELQREIALLVDAEQRRFAQELHDSVAQQLTGLSMMAESCRQDLHEAGSPVAEQTARLVRQIQELQGQVRNLARGLMPVEVDAEGLMAALQDLVEKTATMTGLDCRFECAEAARVDNSTTAHHLYHIVQEAIHNTLKHAKASEIIVRLEKEPGAEANRAALVLTVQDNGRGFIPEANSNGMGQRNMRYRTRLIGGSLEISSNANRGTTVLCRVEPKRIGAAPR